MTTPVEPINDDDLLRKFLEGATGRLYGKYLRANNTYVYHAMSGWYMITRRAEGWYELSLDNPRGVRTPGAPVRWRQRTMKAARARDAGHPVLPVAQQALQRARGSGNYTTPHVVDVNEDMEAVFTLEDRFYLSGYDTQEDPPLYFLCRLPGPADTIDAARESLKPDSVKEALAAGIRVERQGDIFAIQSDMTTKKALLEMGGDIAVGQLKRMITRVIKGKAIGPTTFSKNTPIYGTAHTAPQLARLPNGVMLAKEQLIHAPGIIGQHRPRDHGPRALPGKYWWWLTRNTVPIVGKEGRT